MTHSRPLLLFLLGWSVLWLAAEVLAVDARLPGSPWRVPVGSDGVQRVSVILDSYAFRPSHVIVEAGKPVELTLTSVTMLTPHNFIIDALSVKEEVGAGKTVVLTFTPTQSGTFPIYCDKRLWPLPSHREKGMEGILNVE
ncbi:MAG: quinol oxidase [Nitrospira sp.]|nr:quinol oxidase [Nitrospira sp.]MBH0181382.1 quinol oxidase [Nitrospira sp.]MBH0185075.1 quinol oxidase [Nitrospira sp.]